MAIRRADTLSAVEIVQVNHLSPAPQIEAQTDALAILMPCA
jgi:hypothetical protein